jgi:phage tail-like protein
MALGQRRDPFAAFRFRVEIEGLVVGGFTAVSGLDAEVVVEEYREGGVNDFVHRLPSGTRYSGNLVLERGLGDADALWSWFEDTAAGIVERRNGSVVIVSGDDEDVVRWNFLGAYPVRWSGPQLRADGNTVAMERVELAHRGLVRAR